ncbi:16S rRNA (guanine(966)-N(2))-methyltransferase RsmD [Lactobacillus sp. PV037]|uniref:16S rRNA (guanine(966)-N(2))-methyltransferase RsmD n=1 Tax=unclassified Lactobacillus TaxID=2620435 RepID=UPI00223F97AD|nr:MULTISPECIES: 16S rRNA (guanine(966)-N(2))-methyltransferase RsmD [unclassified Lactobacillus]QNQ82436.1 16S rRNA (guanine(966)-N(2))-methyltransferase RsmD [Lactobacillus sp. PV012]QNQ83451.1 16S rRNA (guanine(966)-N(2))-methyltransferase RsmD [Lactobacillus sp. PV037]
MRIIAGKYAKRNLFTLKSNKTRPTSDKVKGSLFNSMGQFFDGGEVLDLYGGSGALGIEAVSRGYDHATLVDISGQACEIIKKNVALTKEPEKFDILRMRDTQALKYFEEHGKKFDLVFLDPPYAKEKIVKIMTKLLEADLLNEKAWIVAETDEHTELPSIVEGFKMLKNHQLGRTKVKIYERI